VTVQSVTKRQQDGETGSSVNLQHYPHLVLEFLSDTTVASAEDQTPIIARLWLIRYALSEESHQHCLVFMYHKSLSTIMHRPFLLPLESHSLLIRISTLQSSRPYGIASSISCPCITCHPGEVGPKAGGNYKPLCESKGDQERFVKTDLGTNISQCFYTSASMILKGSKRFCLQ
jgi:hypothetical protein